MAYIFIAGWLLICGGCSFPKFNKKYSLKRRKIFLVAFFAVCALIGGLRCVHVGIDTPNYQAHFYNVANASLADILKTFYFDGIEVGYALFIKLCSLLYANYFFFQLVETILFLYLIGRFFLKNTEHVFLATVVFLGLGIFLNFLNVTRQMLAVAIVLNSFSDLKHKYPIRSLIVFGLALTIQISVAVFLISYLVYFLKDKQKLLRFIPILCAFVLIFADTFMGIFIKLFPRYLNYYNRTTINQSAHFIIIVWLIIATFALFTIYKPRKYSPFNCVIAVLSLLFVLCNILGFKVDYAERVGLYFVPFVALLLPSVVMNIKNKQIRNFISFCMSFGFISLFLVSSLGSQQYMNYHFFWSES